MPANDVQRAKPVKRVKPPASDPTPVEPAWDSRHLLGMDGMNGHDIRTLLRNTRRFSALANRPDTRTGDLEGRLVGTCFFEDSTRTRTSFTLAAQRLSAEVIDLPASVSSQNKGESLVDTARTIEAMGIDALIVRSSKAGAAHVVAQHVGCSVVNAGDGRHEHPTQALLDAYTVAEARDRLDDFDLSGLHIVMVGDLANSRVAGSGIRAFSELGSRVTIVGPPNLAPESLGILGCSVCHDFDQVLGDADVVMMLRIQFERHAGQGTIASLYGYRQRYALTDERASHLRSDSIVLHPGPMNRGVEIDAGVADGPHSLILRQVANGVAVRMGVLEHVCRGRSRAT